MTRTGKPMERATVDDSKDMNNNPNIDNDTHTPEEEELPPAYDELDDTALSDTNAQVPETSPTHALSALDDAEVIVDNHLVKADEEVIDTKTFHWEISNWSDLPPRIESPAFEAGGYHWSILLFPRGNNQSEAVSVYIMLADVTTDPEAYACAQFGILVSRPSDPTNYTCLTAHHRFARSAFDWGFVRMVSIDRLLNDDPSSYRGAALLENNCIRITATVRVVKDETGVLWHDFIDYDSKKTTGFVGLKNQGATCYMNSLFQSLYCTNHFRKAVYQIPTDEDDPTGSIVYALQRLFYNLQSSADSVDTVELTRSFGWDSSEAFMQHDVQEFNRILQDTLETKMKNTPADGAIKKLFVGRMRSYIKCINVQYESSRSEDYYDIQLNVKGCNTLADSFADYIAEETLEGENKYSAEGYGLQDAKKGVIFESFPPVLHLQLKRFEYDINRDAMVKINDRHEFPLEIDLEPYLDTSVDRSVPHKYILHGVLVHSGDLSAGHYFAFVKPTKEDRWLRFDDDRVIPVAEKEVLEANYGGEPLGSTYHGFKRFTNAYMLVYIRKSMQDEILADVSAQDIPAHLVTKLEEERKRKDDEDKEKSEEHLHIRVQIITEKAFELNEGFDFIPKNDHLLGNEPTSPIQGLKVRRAMKFGEFKDLLAEKLDTPKAQFRVWSIVNRQNRTIRVDAHIVEADNEEQTISNVLDRYLTTQAVLRIFVERIPTDDQEHQSKGERPPLVPVTDVLVFIKYFDPEKQLISGVGYLYANKTDKIGSISDQVKRMIDYELETEIDLYEEIKPSMTDRMDMAKTFEQAEIQHGDIICVQKSLTRDEQAQLINDKKYPTVPDFLDFMFRRVDIIFTPRNRDPSMELRLTLRKDMQYLQVVQMVADKLQANAMKVQLFTPEVNLNEEPVPIPPTSSFLLGDILRRIGGGIISASPMLLYQVHDISLAELEMKRTLEVTLCTPTLSDTTTMKVMVSKRGCVADLLQMLQAQGATFKSESGTRQARIFQALNNKFHCEFADSDPITAISESQIARLYAEEIPQEELDTYDDEEQPLYLPVFHYQRDLQRTHSVPFQILLKRDEEFSETKKRLQLRTGMNDKDWSKVKFSMVSARSSKPIQDDAIKLWDILLQLGEQSALGLDHIDKFGRVRSVFDKPLSIRG